MGNKLYILKSGSLFRANLNTWQIEQQLTREDGLSGSDIVDICYSEQINRLSIVYSDGNIDVLHPDGSIWTIPDLDNAPMAGIDKSIIGISEQEGQLYIRTAYGFLVVDLQNEVILQNFNLGFAVNCAWGFNGKWYYSTNNGTYSCPMHGNPYAPDGWQSVESQVIKQALVFQREGFEQCWLVSSDNSLRKLTSDNTVSIQCTAANTITDLRRAARFIMASGNDSLVLYDASFGLPPTLGNRPQAGQRRVCPITNPYGSAIDICSLGYDGNLVGLLYNSTGFQADTLTLEGASTVRLHSLHAQNLSIANHQQSGDINRICLSANGEVGMTYVPALSTGYGAMLKINGFLTTHNASTGKWQNYDQSVVSGSVDYKKRFIAVDDMIADPLHPSRYWFGTLEDGIIGIDNGNFFARYEHSTDEGIGQCAPLCTRVGSIAISPSGDIWCVNEGMSNFLRVRRDTDGAWLTYVIPGLEKSYGFTHLLHTWHNGRHQVWGYQQMKYQVVNLFAYDYGTDIANTSDDKATYFKTLTAESGIPFTPYYGRGVYEGPTGAIWVLNTSGLYAIDEPDSVFSHPGIVRTISNSYIPTSMTIDSRDRVWIGTEANGLYLLSSDGRTTYDHLTSSNSQLPSDEILSIAYDSIQSTLWIATSGNISTYKYDTSDYDEAEPFISCAYGWPNTAQVGSNVCVSVFGLQDGSDVSIENSQAHVMLQAEAIGGMLSIDTSSWSVGEYSVRGTDKNGNHGALLKFSITTKNGEESQQ